MNNRLRIWRIALLAAFVLAGCGGGGGGGGNGDVPGPGPGPGPVPTPDPTDPFGPGSLSMTSTGGTATGTSQSSGGAGGDLRVDSGGSLYVGVNPPPGAYPITTPPSGGTGVVSWIDEQTIVAGDALLGGEVTAASSGSTATLNIPNGDLLIQGTLTSTANLEINVPGGTVWILGTIRTGRVDGTDDGTDGGDIRITAVRIIFTGTIDTRGEDRSGAEAGRGGDIIFDTAGAGQTGQVLVGGSMDSSGGAGSGDDPRGGAGGAFQTFFPGGASGGTVHVSGTTFTSNGGAANGTGLATGGAAGRLDLQANAGVFFNGVWTAVGGAATSSNAGARGGDGGPIFVNDQAISDSGPVSVFGSIQNSGGAATGASGTVSGGSAGDVVIDSGSDINLGKGTFLIRGADSARGGRAGDATFNTWGDIYYDSTLNASDGSGTSTVSSDAAGTVEFETFFGDITLLGSVVANGGNGSHAGKIDDGPSRGGIIRIQAGPRGGSITVRGALEANGGADGNDADPTDGARGGFIQLFCRHTAGSIYLDPGSSLLADGGGAGGASGTGGAGGDVELLTGGGTVGGLSGGSIDLRGLIKACGAPGSAGGTGGSVLVHSDSSISSGGMDGRGGDITLHAGSTVNVCGGAGSSGGDAKNDGGGGVTSPTAVTFDADGSDMNSPDENGIVRNLGSILAHGSSPAATGGDVLFDGLDPFLNPSPAAGSIDQAGAAGAGNFEAR